MGRLYGREGQTHSRQLRTYNQVRTTGTWRRSRVLGAPADHAATEPETYISLRVGGNGKRSSSNQWTRPNPSLPPSTRSTIAFTSALATSPPSSIEPLEPKPLSPWPRSPVLLRWHRRSCNRPHRGRCRNHCRSS